MATDASQRSLLARGLANPALGFRRARALAKGHWYKFWFRLRGFRFTAGRNFRVNGSLSLRGPGTVTFGDDILINGHVTPWTQSAEAQIVIGNNVMLGSTRFGCVKEILIGDDCLIASAQFTDTDFHSVQANRRTDEAPIRVAPIRLERNVWIGENAAILPGTTIGENSVVGFATVCMRPYPANSVILGNPGKVVGPIPAAGMPNAGVPASVTASATSPALTGAL
jgi:acetyltransferase-like isoleucine patch superfamily enzyme